MSLGSVKRGRKERENESDSEDTHMDNTGSCVCIHGQPKRCSKGSNFD